jgi:two-component system, cell cycle sensor histidine kinase and response regulator CckA
MSEKAIRILIVDDNDEDFEILRILFSKVKHCLYELQKAKNLSDGLEQWRRCVHDVYLVDYKLGPESGIDFLRQAALEEKSNAPIILLTGFGDYELDIEAMRLGAADFLNKSKLDSDILERSIRYALERKKAEAGQSQLAAILSQSIDAVLGTDMEGKVTAWNHGAEMMFGYTPVEIIGQSVAILSPEDKRERMIEMRNQALEGKSISSYETVRMKKDRTLLQVSSSVSPIKDTQGKVIGVSAIIRDITESKKQEEQIRLSQKMDAIGRLAGGVAHDFNNLLSVIGCNIEFLMDDLKKDSSQREELQDIQNAVQQGAQLTKQLLVFGQKQVSQPQAVNLNALSGEMNKMFKRVLEAAIDFSVVQDKDLKSIQADPGQIQQVILNLVLNAQDAMPKGGSLKVETKNVEIGEFEEGRDDHLPPGNYVRLDVADTGMGMTAEIQKHIFEPFFTTKAGKGTGLGLASVYSIVKQWNGFIFVHSLPGYGTTFCIFFPAIDSVEKMESKPRQQALITTGSETLLVVEDQEPLRKVLVKTLEKQGYRVLQARDGAEGVQKALDHPGVIDLLLTDVIMPKMNGKELADELKKARPKIKVVFTSGYPHEVLSRQGALDASIHLIQKPFELDFLTGQIRNILDEKEVLGNILTLPESRRVERVKKRPAGFAGPPL